MIRITIYRPLMQQYRNNKGFRINDRYIFVRNNKMETGENKLSCQLWLA
jgi:hypothetical protein